MTCFNRFRPPFGKHETHVSSPLTIISAFLMAIMVSLTAINNLLIPIDIYSSTQQITCCMCKQLYLSLIFPIAIGFFAIYHQEIWIRLKSMSWSYCNSKSHIIGTQKPIAVFSCIFTRQHFGKLIYYNVLNPDKKQVELYNIADDPAETTDLSGKFPDKVKELLENARKERTPSAIFQFDASQYEG